MGNFDGQKEDRNLFPVSKRDTRPEDELGIKERTLLLT
jgi:hypothetical protein